MFPLMTDCRLDGDWLMVMMEKTMGLMELGTSSQKIDKGEEEEEKKTDEGERGS